MKNLKNLIANKWFAFYLILASIGFFNGIIAVFTFIVCIGLMICNSKPFASAFFFILTVTSLLLSMLTIYYSFEESLNSTKHAALQNIYLAIHNDADKCEPGTNENDKDIWMTIKEKSMEACIQQTYDEQQDGIKKLQVATWGILANSFSLASTFISDNNTQDLACFKLLNEYQRICPQVPGSKFDKEWEEYKRKYLPETTFR